MHVELHPDAILELAEASEWYDARRQGLREVVLAVAHQHRRSGYWLLRAEGL